MIFGPFKWELNFIFTAFGIMNYVTEGYSEPVDIAIEMALTIANKENFEESWKKDAKDLSLIQ